MDRRSFIAAGLASWAVAPPLATAQGGWVLMGSRMISWTSSRDSIMVTRTWGPINALSFRTRGGELFLTNIEVSFTRGGRDRIPMNMRVRPNVRSNTIRLRNRNGDVRRVDFTYRRVNGGGSMRTTLELFGRR
jgi:hypothetical protein